MYDKCYLGMWRYAITKKLRKRINKAMTKLMCIKIDEESADALTHSMCGTHVLHDDCPFFAATHKSDHCGYCLAPDNDKMWHDTKKQEKQFISPVYEKRNYMVVGCYIAIFCERGYATYNRLLRWRKRLSGKIHWLGPLEVSS